MYRIVAEQEITADLADVWTAATDVARWPSWDPHEEQARLEGAFEVGCRGWSKPHGGPGTWWTITVVEPGRAWGSSCALPGGGLSGLSTFTPLAGGRVRCRKEISVTGPLMPLFRVWFGPRIRRDLIRSFRALEAEAARLARLPRQARPA